MANCVNCGAYVDTYGEKCSDCKNNTYLVDTFTSYMRSQQEETRERNRSSYSDNDTSDSDYNTTDYDSSDYSSSSYADQRNGFVSFLFGLIIGVGVCSTTFLILAKLPITDALIRGFIIFGGLLTGFIVSLLAWRNKKNILFIITLGIAIPGLYLLVKEIMQLK